MEEKDIPIFNEEDKKVAVDYCKKFIRENGYIRIGFWVKQQVDGKLRRFGKPTTDEKHFINSVSAMLVNTGKYTRHGNSHPGDYDILLNPAYYRHQSVIWLTIAAVSISLFTLIKDLAKSDKPQVQQLKELQQQVQNQTQSLENIQTSLEGISSSIRKQKTDTSLVRVLK
jgi:hypothetical protein